MPKKRKYAEWSRHTRKGQTAQRGEQDLKEGYLVTLDSMKTQVLLIEQLYTQQMVLQDREWSKQQTRDEFLEEIKKVEEIEDLYALLYRLDEGLSSPWQVSRKELNPVELKDKEEELKKASEAEENPHPMDEIVENVFIRRRKMPLFRFWPKDNLRNAWRIYISSVEGEKNQNASYIAV
jgi:hypothetical protein